MSSYSDLMKMTFAEMDFASRTLPRKGRGQINTAQEIIFPGKGN
jgi:hypothetical protein